MAFVDKKIYNDYKVSGVRTTPTTGMTVKVVRVSDSAVLLATVAMAEQTTGLFLYTTTGAPLETGTPLQFTFITTDSRGVFTDVVTQTLSAAGTGTGTSAADGGFLTTTIRRIRTMVDEPDVDAKYDDDYLIADVIEPACAQVWDDVNLTASDAIVARMTLSMVSGTLDYLLPPIVGKLWRVSVKNSVTDLSEREAVPRSPLHAWGGGYEIHGNVLRFSPAPTETVAVVIEFTPVMDVRMHKGTGSRDTGDTTSLTLDSTPTQGVLDNRPNAYVGCMIRILDDGSTPISEQERIVTSYDNTTGEALVSPAFSPALGSGTITYEITPPTSKAFYNVVAMRGALTLLASKGGSDNRYMKVMREYQAAIRALRNVTTWREARVGPRFHSDTVDNRDRWPLSGGQAATQANGGASL